MKKEKPEKLFLFSLWIKEIQGYYMCIKTIKTMKARKKIRIPKHLMDRTIKAIQENHPTESAQPKIRIKAKPIAKKRVITIKADEFYKRQIAELGSCNEDVTKMKILVATNEIGEKRWNKALPISLRSKEKVIVSLNQDNVGKGYVRVKHGKSDNRTESIFAIDEFVKLDGSIVRYKSREHYLNILEQKAGIKVVQPDFTAKRFSPYQIVKCIKVLS